MKCQIIINNQISECVNILSSHFKNERHLGCKYHVITNNNNLSQYASRAILENNDFAFCIDFFNSSFDWINKQSDILDSTTLHNIITKKKDLFWRFYQKISKYVSDPSSIYNIIKYLIDNISESDGEMLNKTAFKKEYKAILEDCSQDIFSSKHFWKEAGKTKYKLLYNGSKKNIVLFLSRYASKEELDFFVNLSKQKHVNKVIIFVCLISHFDQINPDYAEDSFSILPNFHISDNTPKILDHLVYLEEVHAIELHSEFKESTQSNSILSSIQNAITEGAPTTLQENDSSFQIVEHKYMESEVEFIRNEIYSHINKGVDPSRIVIASTGVTQYMPMLSKWLNTERHILVTDKGTIKEFYGIKKIILSLFYIHESNSNDFPLIAKVLESTYFASCFPESSKCAKYIKSLHTNSLSFEDILSSKLSFCITHAEDFTFLEPAYVIHRFLSYLSNAKTRESTSYYSDIFISAISELQRHDQQQDSEHTLEFNAIKRDIHRKLHTKVMQETHIDKEFAMMVLKSCVASNGKHRGERNDIFISDLSENSIVPCDLLIICGLSSSRLDFYKKQLLPSGLQASTAKTLKKSSEILSGIIATKKKCIFTYSSYGSAGKSWIIQYFYMLVRALIIRNDFQIMVINDGIISSERMRRSKIHYRHHVDMLKTKISNKDIKALANFQRDEEVKIISFDRLANKIKYRKYSGKMFFSAKEVANPVTYSKLIAKNFLNSIKGVRNLKINFKNKKFSDICKTGSPITICFRPEVKKWHFDNEKQLLFLPNFKTKGLELHGDIFAYMIPEEGLQSIKVIHTVFSKKSAINKEDADYLNLLAFIISNSLEANNIQTMQISFKESALWNICQSQNKKLKLINKRLNYNSMSAIELLESITTP